MSSAILAIYDAVAAWTPVYDTNVSVAVRDIDQLTNTLNAGDCPVRMLSVTTGDQSGEFAFIALGKLNRVTWTITDRLYMRAAALGSGLKEYSASLIQYAVSYIDQVRNNRAPTAQSEVIDARFVPGIFEWPEGGGTYYAGVDVVLTVDEFMGGA